MLIKIVKDNDAFLFDGRLLPASITKGSPLTSRELFLHINRPNLTRFEILLQRVRSVEYAFWDFYISRVLLATAPDVECSNWNACNIAYLLSGWGYVEWVKEYAKIVFELEKRGSNTVYQLYFFHN
ncbi:hypothetical protein SAMN02745161_0899 [Halodesulfovibrio marinisediminis DSM 17456]|uniref:Uncharacterized protein n=1 Tax=Halodesulfovibrio marinisediminis DSM 17456 TaxID=1121457 RepID=A0A1N6ECV9_9BACT|nr:hypothetical protein SAMN02745161_0899 [Halodesulfovibrio marinisediminis DSM 17456]